MICGADYQNNSLILLGYTNQVLSQSFAWIFTGITNSHFFESEGLMINFDLPYYSQTEGLCFISPQLIYISSETSFDLSANLYSFDLDDLLDIDEYEMSFDQKTTKALYSTNLLGQIIDHKSYRGIIVTIYDDFSAKKTIQFQWKPQ
jgi:hypothetical protein